MTKERNDYSGPIQDELPLEEFSKEFLLNIMRLWGEFWEAFESGLVRKGDEMEEVGALNALELLSRTFEEVAPPVFEKIADFIKADKNTIEGRMKAGSFAMDNMYDHYPGHYEIISDNEAYATYPKCHVMEKQTTGGDIEVLRYVCQYVEPRIAKAYMNYPGARKVKVDMLKIPESFDLEPGEPCCKWRFYFEDEND